MDLHGNAALSWSGRRELARRVVDQGWTLTAAAEAAGVSVRCARKWSRRYRAGDRGLLDRSSAPRRVANRTAPERVRAIVRLRRLRMTAAEIAEALAMPLSTVSGILTRLGMGKLGRIGLEQPVRYERSRPGELIHVDVKKLGRIYGGAGKRAFGDTRRRTYASYTDRDGHRRGGKGWDYVHVAVDDHSRLAYAEVLADETATTAAAFLRRAIAHYQRYGITVERVLTDNGSCYRGVIHALACRALGVPTHTHPPPSPTNQRQSRTLHPHHAQRLGLRRHLRLKPRTHPST